jgi:transposase InsO family protein
MQKYHSNAKTNEHVRAMIRNSTDSASEISNNLGVSIPTVTKWSSRDLSYDLSSRPHTIHYSLSDIEQEVISSIRKLTWMPLDDLVETVQINIPHAKRTAIYGVLKRKSLNKVPEAKRKEAKKFKEYEPGFLHVDVTYLPKINGIKMYLFVAIDRATRTIFYYIYESKSASNAVDFIDKCKDFFPMKITHMLTDNGLEFTDRFVGKVKAPSGNHKFDISCKTNDIEHRLTQAYTPKTNGMVERANGIIKDATIKSTIYLSKTELEYDLIKFLLYYNFNRRHSGLKKELKVRTPFEAIETWFEIKPELFKESPSYFKQRIYRKFETTYAN